MIKFAPEGNFIHSILFLGDLQFFLEIAIATAIVGYNFTKRKYFWLILPIILLLALPLYFMPSIHLFGFRLNYLIDLLLVIVIFSFCFREKLINIFIAAVTAFGLQHFTWNFLYVIFDSFPQIENMGGHIIFLFYIWTYIFIYLIAFIILYFSKIRIAKNTKNIVLFILSCITLLITFILSQAIREWNIITRSYTALSALLCILLIFSYPYAFKNVVQQRKLIEEKQTLERLLEQQASHNEMYLETREFLRVQLHDLKHQLDYLSRIDNKDDFDNYIKEIKNNLLIYDSFAKTGNNVIDVVLTQKSLFCASKNIRFTYMVDAEPLSIFSNNDLASLFGNIIDNAIEASMKVKDDFRLIKLNVYTNNNILIISQSNYTNVIPEFVSDLPKTTKINTLAHGYGLKSIKYICHKYNGQMNIEFEDNKFRIELMFPLEK